MRIAVLSAAVWAGLAWAACAQSVGVLARPCDAVAAMPPEVADYMARMRKARAEHQPAPVPSAQALAIYARWQSDGQAKDFAGLCHYADANGALPPATSGRVIFFGDSITELWKMQDPAAFAGDVLDRGVSGQTTAQMLIRFRADVIDLKPRVVQIMAGTNDIAGNTGPTSITWIENNIRSMVELAQANHIHVVLASIPPAAAFKWRPEMKPIDSILAVNAWLAAYARERRLIFVDYYSALDDGHHGLPPAFSKDGVHPTIAGYAVMDPLAKRAIAEAIRTER